MMKGHASVQMNKPLSLMASTYAVQHSLGSQQDQVLLGLTCVSQGDSLV
jgi:hypothetical protein